jgi:hypothetical protein
MEETPPSKYRRPDSKHSSVPVRPRAQLFTGADDLKTASESGTDLILNKLREKREKKAYKKKWGRGLTILGVVTVLNSCILFRIPLLGPFAAWAGAVMTIVGIVLLLEPPRMRETNEALLVAAKYDNRLTVPRLALEMDISLKKAEKIIQELVRSGIAEIDLEDSRPEDGLIYKVKGI